jgi:hypothetical protein
MRWFFLVLALSACGPADLAACLTQKGVVMYGAFWCPHCAAQKEAFGASFSEVHYVECSNPDHSETQACTDLGVMGYPTWVFPSGVRLEGEQTLETLKGRAGC